MPQEVTIADVAAAAQVHPSTASRALNARTEHQVNSETVVRVRAAAKELGYRPNVVARGLRMSASMTIGVLIPDLTNPLFPPIVRGITDYLAPRGYTALIANTDNRLEAEHAALESLQERRVDGLIIASGSDHDPWLMELYESGAKAVLVNRGAGTVPFPLVTGDDAAGVTAAVTHLLELGHRRLVHLAGPEEFSTARSRREAFEKACRSAGAEYRVAGMANLSVNAGREAVDGLLAANDFPFTAMVASNDLTAVGALRSLRAHGVHCPDDVSVVGFNDMPFAEDFDPPLTTLRIPQHQFGEEAARLLLDGLASGVLEPKRIILPTSLVVRESTAPAPQR